jgi:hypothetical protein
MKELLRELLDEGEERLHVIQRRPGGPWRQTFCIAAGRLEAAWRLAASKPGHESFLATVHKDGTASVWTEDAALPRTYKVFDVADEVEEPDTPSEPVEYVTSDVQYVEETAYKTAYHELFYRVRSLEASRDENGRCIVRLRDRLFAFEEACRKALSQRTLDPIKRILEDKDGTQ